MTESVSFPVPEPEADLDAVTSLADRIYWVHARVRHQHPRVHRIAIALYDGRSDMLRTYVDSSDAARPLALYECTLARVPSLLDLAHNHAFRIVDDLAGLPAPHGEHTLWLTAQGYRSSYTVPLYKPGGLLGFLFFNSREPGQFHGQLLQDLQIHVQLCRQAVLDVVDLSRTVGDLAWTTRGTARLRNTETVHHLDRMSSYSRVIARGVARKFGRSDEFVEHVYLFAPLHDIGKIGVADNILLKPGPLTDEERQTMQGHVGLGGQLIEDAMRSSGQTANPGLPVLHNVVLCHHEFMDGSGYPQGLCREAVPLEARIVTIADIFDALTSDRPYRQPCSNDEALVELQRMADDGKLDPLCVAALGDAGDEVRAIQQRFGLSA